MNTSDKGRSAENLVAEYLIESGYQILKQNWRTKACEIDIIAKKKKSIYFVEVKYRKNSIGGGGLEAITPAKLKQMQRSVEIWLSVNKWPGKIELLAAEVNSSGYINLVEC
ncbi:YraN family protein [Candidatus Saccharibacteria bacterium]|nr:YraN family protein [Candidatus Saccharibacteria bacterium]MCB9821604.1 YraN family protein [Candidatus Nomurabacteria bacterium]